MPEHLANEALVLVAASTAGVWLCARLRWPVVLGCLVAGLVVGPHGTGMVGETPGGRFLVELGVVFLMFTIGLDFSLGALWGARKAVFAAGGLQVLLTTLVVASGALLAGLEVDDSLLVGGVVSMSSTALVVKQLVDQGELFTQHGRLVVGILLFQDLARCRLIVATFSYPRLVERIVHHARQVNPSIAMIVSAAEEAELPLLARAGVTAVFPENLAAGLALGNQALLLLGRSHEDAAKVITELRELWNPELAGHIGI